ncbi:hypothetical protein ZEAMMB73_Zm00001d020088 [Zea mays]|jgi:hypothetical protein|uniref:Uncharacterized protein n=1 Tax=Zea mays TaxID=4577 RepID=A0A1D6I213_MAIZE|nr:hypothetical protein ZEAMMB73_Zm00001d020088 [Zea mays]ONM54263.1 hypothetical protein ZEAMMB73_Zm00001d020088 [Zea mays]
MNFGRGVDLCTDVWFCCRLLTPLILVRGRLDSDGEVTSEVDQVRALQEEVVIQVQLHQGQEFIDKNAVTISSVALHMHLQLWSRDLF